MEVAFLHFPECFTKTIEAYYSESMTSLFKYADCNTIANYMRFKWKIENMVQMYFNQYVRCILLLK